MHANLANEREYNRRRRYSHPQITQIAQIRRGIAATDREALKKKHSQNQGGWQRLSAYQ
jgi:hypothetical protein